MQYYSRSPKETEAALEKKNDTSKRRRGHIILFVDLIVIALILIFLNHNPAILNKDRMPTVVKEKSFTWRNASFNASCLMSGICRLSWQGSPQTDIYNVHWELKRDEAMLFSERQKFRGGHLEWQPLDELQEKDQVYVRFVNAEADELLEFRVYP